MGNEYEVNCDVEFHENVDVIMHIDDTINYVTIDQIIRRRMAIPTPLLETVIMEIGNEIHSHFPILKSIKISIKKLHVPIKGIQGSAGVTWQKHF